jgi:hypothetical protein
MHEPAPGMIDQEMGQRILFLESLACFKQLKEDVIQHLENPRYMRREPDYFDIVRRQHFNEVSSQTHRAVVHEQDNRRILFAANHAAISNV